VRYWLKTATLTNPTCTWRSNGRHQWGRLHSHFTKILGI